MKLFLGVGAAVAAIVCSGCVSTTYTKSVAITKDANGKVIQVVEYEGVTQPNQHGWPVQLEHLKGVRPGDSR